MQDVETGGRYDARRAALHLWSHCWSNDATRDDPEPMGTFYVRWGEENGIWLIQTEAGYTLDELLQELGRLERIALDHMVHGTLGASPCDR
jgi:hypothetical protein